VAAAPHPVAPFPVDHLPPPVKARQAPVFALLRAGDSAYAQKAGYQSFARALVCYDRALALASRLLARLPGQRGRALYARYLVAHAYEKVPDSLRAVQTLRQVHRTLAAYPDSTRRRMLFVVEMALSSTQVRNYGLADTLLRQFVYRPALVNDPASYDFLTHYYLVQSRLAVYYRHHDAGPYLDSLQRAYRSAARPLDRLFLSQQLARLLADAGRYPAAYRFLATSVHIGDSLVDGGDLSQLRNALVASEQREESQVVAASRSHKRTIWGLSIGLGIISLLSFYLARQGRRAQAQSRRLATTNRELATANRAVATANQQLDAQVAQVELLNKEIQHRIKNNLHMVHSLLRMQERLTDNEEVHTQLQAARLRVESIATLHDQLLYRAPGLDVAEFLRTLISAVVACLANGRQVLTHLRTDDLPLPPDSHLPLSLILNEWVTNSVKYATPADQTLEIKVNVTRQANHTCIDYADNGQPTGAEPPVPSLGTQLISLLTRQLHATLTTPPDQPFRYTLRLPHVLPR
jgi:two-component sensor histidine kinase